MKGIKSYCTDAMIVCLSLIVEMFIIMCAVTIYIELTYYNLIIRKVEIKYISSDPLTLIPLLSSTDCRS